MKVVIVSLLSLGAVVALPKALPRTTLDLSYEISPGDDFYEFVNKKWEDNAVIPATESQISAFLVIHQANEIKLKSLVDSAVEQSADTRSNDYVTSLIADLYKSGMDEEAIEASSADAIKPFLQEIEAISSIEEAFQVAWSQKVKGLNGGFFGAMSSDFDAKNSSLSIGAINFGGFGLPKSYYEDHDSTASVLNAYVMFIQQLFVAAGHTEGKSIFMANQVLGFEKELAAIALTPEEGRNITLVTNMFQYSELNAKFPGIPWNVVSDATKLSAYEIGPIVMDCTRCFTRLGSLLHETPLEIIKTYLTANFLKAASSSLGKQWTDILFEYSKSRSGQTEQQPRWKKILAMLNVYLGEAVGKLYVEKYFPPEKKVDVLEMIKILFESIKVRINAAEWMSEETRIKALEKIATFRVKIGYPDQWDDFSPLESLLDKDLPFLNKLAVISQWGYETEIKKEINKPADRERWFMSPQTVNAYYSPNGNEIVFPAAILVEPFYFAPDESSSSDQNKLNRIKSFGAIGAVIGHEIMHGFDDSGSQFDLDGNLNDWWTAEDKVNYGAKVQQITEQYNQYQVLGLNVSGELTAGENIADLGGLVSSFYAMETFLDTTNSQNLRDISGLTPQQLFFVSFAQLWRRKIRDPAAIKLIKTDPHSPNKFRVNGVLTNLPEFYRTFDVKVGEKMYREKEDRVEIF